MLKNRINLLAADPWKPMEKFFYASAIFEILEQGLNRDTRVFK